LLNDDPHTGAFQLMVLGLFTERRRRRLREKPFPPAWQAIIRKNVPVFERLSPDDRAELLGHVQVFLAEKSFEGCGGLELTDEIRVTIAAQACMLLLHRETDYYPELTSILVYPSGYVVEGERFLGGGIWEEGGEGRLGHTARELRAMVLAWDAAKQGAADPGDGKNLVLHEFAHQLDFENLAADGTPALLSRGAYVAWARIMSEELEALRAADDAGLPTILDRYGAANPAEFFAVATEAFFERPFELRDRHPDLYRALAGFFSQDPTSFSEDRSRQG
jgi:Mlc titration factor MtfA (ptsG expression regulator)